MDADGAGRPRWTSPLARRRRHVAADDGAGPAGDFGGAESSIISEAAPSELAGWRRTERRSARNWSRTIAAAALPVIGAARSGSSSASSAASARGARPGRRDDRLAMNGASRKGSAQVAATGQALMQSQRLAKSVSQALVGSPQAFPEVRESRRAGAGRAAEDRRRARWRRAGAPCRNPRRRCCRWSSRAPRRTPASCCCPAEDPDPGGPGAARHQPPVVRPARGAETVSTLKLQQDAAAAEISASASW